MTERVLVVAAHPDDEVLGCGGAVASHARRGDEVSVLIMAEGATSRATTQDEAEAAEVAELRAAAREAAKALGVNPPRMLGLPDNRLDEVALLDVIKPIEDIVSEFAPDTVYTHHAGDLNIDHQTVHRAVLTACRPLPGSSVTAIYTFETLSSTEWGQPDAGETFIPRRFIDISSTMDVKLAALACYAGEMRPFPHARSTEAVRALAEWRGASVGMPAAEAFDVIRQRVSD